MSIIKDLTYEELFNTVTSSEQNIELEKIYPCTNIDVETPSGWTSILGVMKKVGKGIKIKTETNREFHGEEKHLIMSADGWVYLRDVEFVVTKDNEIEKVVSKEYTGETTFYDISLPPPHLYYSPNGLIHHNTWVVTDTINKEGLKKGADWYVIKGKITTSALYQTLFMHRKGGILVFDDTDSCTGDTKIRTDVGHMKIEDLFKVIETTGFTGVTNEEQNQFVLKPIETINVLSVNEDKNIISSNLNYIMKHKVNKRLFEIKVGDKSIKVTEDHSCIVHRNGELISVKPLEINKETDEIVYINA